MLKAQGLRWRNAILKALSASGLSGVRRCIPRPWRHGLRSTLEKSIHRDFEFVRSMEWQQLSVTTGITPGGIHANHEGMPLLPLPALDLHGYFSRWLGLGECARLFARALIASGYPVVLHDVDVDIPHARRDRTLTEYFDNASGSGNDLVFINPDYWEAALRRMGEDRSGRRIMGYWFWELEHFPESWLPALDQVDEILVSSVFVERAMQQVSTKPVTRIPIPVVPCAGSGLQRRHFGLDDDDYVFLCTFDFSSTIARKNPHAVIEAFRLAFPAGDEEVCLMLKSSNGQHHSEWLMDLVRSAAGDDRIMIRDDMLERDDLWALQRCCDAYVSLHRCEGFGLGMAEAMCLGKPVVATAYSGNMDYMTEANSCLVDYRVIPVTEGEYPYAEGQQWADPDVGHAATHMSRLYRERAWGTRLGTQAAIDMARDFSMEASIRALAGCLQQKRESCAAGT
ncbi:glycosyltransferase family 4 protein [Rhodanobacter glycinis]|uniref:Glycosyltransferase family 4 protein n=1 Tax=Rhodanobacter glycinis TaxID=582702 RepID=A0A5B9DV88_9GAMM|nr:glycosyltransferase family 4 protein [Rhodanobacter glycinis]QEE23683.1 glycosyltransferase family 4 protein [Rhodanobacter glycinis]